MRLVRLSRREDAELSSDVSDGLSADHGWHPHLRPVAERKSLGRYHRNFDRTRLCRVMELLERSAQVPKKGLVASTCILLYLIVFSTSLLRVVTQSRSPQMRKARSHAIEMRAKS